MDLCVEMLLRYLPAQTGWQVESRCPKYRRWFASPHPGPGLMKIEPTALAAGRVESPNQNVRPEASAYGSQNRLVRPEASAVVSEKRAKTEASAYGSWNQKPGMGATFHKIGRNADRMVNRWWTYPRFIRQHRQQYDWFHVVDHSYAFLVHQLPADRTGVYCHDLDTFRCLTQPEREPRPWWFRKMAERILSGLQKAAVVFYSTEVVRNEMVRFGLLDSTKLVHAPYGVDAVFQVGDPQASCPHELMALEGMPWLLHVGATIPRKRIDVLLNVLAAAREKTPELRLCKIGGDWTAEQQAQIDRNDLARSIVHLGKVSQPLLVQAYQRTSAVLITSDAEGFGLPVIEAMACGAPVIASDIPVLRESGGTAANFAAVGDIEAWVEMVMLVLNEPSALAAGNTDFANTSVRPEASAGGSLKSAQDRGEGTVVPNLETRLAWAAKFSWEEHARIIAEAYRRM